MGKFVTVKEVETPPVAAPLQPELHSSSKAESKSTTPNEADRVRPPATNSTRPVASPSPEEAAGMTSISIRPLDETRSARFALATMPLMDTVSSKSEKSSMLRLSTVTTRTPPPRSGKGMPRLPDTPVLEPITGTSPPLHWPAKMHFADVAHASHHCRSDTAGLGLKYENRFVLAALGDLIYTPDADPPGGGCGSPSKLISMRADKSRPSSSNVGTVTVRYSPSAKFLNPVIAHAVPSQTVDRVAVWKERRMSSMSSTAGKLLTHKLRVLPSLFKIHDGQSATAPSGEASLG
mmetsp:Transcript_15061/g.30244  ORF Transcript_15061/g.30244 Transcript_15061/m.30244 type:complete len:292 (+) Transcript_15061:5098-5973(+)